MQYSRPVVAVVGSALEMIQSGPVGDKSAAGGDGQCPTIDSHCAIYEEDE